MSKTFAWFVYALTAAFFASFFAWPICAMLRGAFFNADGRFTLAFVSEVFRNRIYLEGLGNSLFIAVGSTAVALCLALPLSIAADRYVFPGRKLLTAIILVPMILPPFVGAIGVRQILGQYGAANALLTHLGLLATNQTIDWLGKGRLWGVIALNALHLYPILFLNLTAALAHLDPSMAEAAENLGCTGFRKIRRITLPLIIPGLFAGGALVFIFAFTELGVPLIFDLSRVMPVQIFYGIKEIAGNPFPFALVAVMLGSTALLYFPVRLLFGQTSHATVSRASTAAYLRTPGPFAQWACTLGFIAVTVVALLPHVGVVLFSVAGDWYRSVLPVEWTTEHYRAALHHTLAAPSILNSLKYAGLATACDLILGVLIAYVIVRTTLPGRSALDSMAMLPLAAPGLVLAFGYISMTQEGRTFAFLNPSKDPTFLLVIAYAVRRLPYVVRATAAGFQQTSVTLEEAARNLGSTPWRALRRVTLPLIAPNVLAGGLLAFAFAMLEVSDSLVLAQKHEHFPITKAIYELFLMMGEGRFVAAALGVWAMAFLALVILAANRMLGKKFGTLFRA